MSKQTNENKYSVLKYMYTVSQKKKVRFNVGNNFAKSYGYLFFKILLLLEKG